MSGFWSSETMKVRLKGLIDPYVEDRVENCSYELSLGEQVFVTGEDRTRRDIVIGTQILIPPGQFANLLTLETVSVPNDALGLISMKFTLKQPGLVNVSGFHVDPGYTGKLLFSVYNAGPQAVPITSGKPAFLLWYCSLDTATDDLYEKAPRKEITDSDVKQLGGDVFTPQALAARIDTLEDRIKFGLWVAGLVIAALVSIGVGRLFTDEDTGSDHPATTTTVSLSTPSTSDGRVPTTTLPTSASPGTSTP
jgi:dCTP deaminase